MNIFSLHGKWYEDNENRLTSNVLFFLDQFRSELLTAFLDKFTPYHNIDKTEINNCKINFQVYDSGKIPDAEIILTNNTRILIESKVRSNIIGYNQVEEYCNRLVNSSINYPNYHLLIITQTDQSSLVSSYSIKLQNNGICNTSNISYIQWKDVIELFQKVINNSKDIFLIRLMRMFLEEVENVMYNRIDIQKMQVKDLHEIVLTTQKPEFLNMALEDCVFWPYANFTPSQYVAYYFTKNCPKYGLTISHIAQIKHIWHNVTIDEVLTSIPEFQTLPDFNRFKQRALGLYNQGNPGQFAIAITEKPIELRNPIPYIHDEGNKFRPNILPGRHTTLSKFLSANKIEDLY